MAERLARWERALACTRSEILIEAVLAASLLVLAFLLRPGRTTLLSAASGLLMGTVVQLANRFILSQPLFLSRIDWGSDPRPATPRQSHLAGLMLALLTAIGIGAVFLASGRDRFALVAFFGGSFAAYALIALLQRIQLERDFLRRAPR